MTREARAAVRALDTVRLTPLQRRVALVLAADVGTWLKLAVLVDRVYGEDPGGGPLDGSSTVIVTCRKIVRRLVGAPLRLERRHGERRLTWRRKETP